MLIKNVVLERIKAGEITLIFRRWKKCGVKAGGTQMTQRGVLAVDSVVKSAARSASTSIGRQIGNTIVRGILGGIFGGSTSKKKSSWF